ncbi:MAG: hypothetical protein M1837_005790 [Sclerophora amabilis]|nr:MAG: hypothetical protein M1837_005790 [Sclerophora amabilis]
MAYDQNTPYQRPFAASQGRQSPAPRHHQQGYYDQQPGEDGRSYGDQFGGEYGGGMNGGYSQDWGATPGDNYHHNTGGGGRRDIANYQNGRVPKARPNASSGGRTGDGYSDDYGPQQRDPYQSANGHYAPQWQEDPQGHAAMAGKAPHKSRAHSPFDRNRANESSRYDAPHGVSSLDDEYRSRDRGSFEHGPGEQRNGNSGKHVKQNRPGNQKNPPRSKPNPKPLSWDSPFPKFQGVKKNSGEVEPADLDQSMSRMHLENKRRGDGSRKKMPTNGILNRDQSYTSDMGSDFQSERSQTEYADGQSVSRDGPYVQHLNHASNRKPLPLPVKQQRPSRNGTAWEPQTAPVSPLEPSFEKSDQRSMTMPDEINRPRTANPHQNYPGQRQYQSPQMNQGSYHAPYQQDSRMPTSASHPSRYHDELHMYSDERHGDQFAPKGARRAPKTAQHAERQQSIGDFFDSYYETPKDRTTQPATYEETGPAELEMPNFDALPPARPWGHQRGMTIDQHLKTARPRGAPPLPHQPADHGQVDDHEAYQSSKFAAQALRSRSQPDLRGQSANRQRFGQQNGEGRTFEASRGAPDAYGMPSHTNERAYNNYQSGQRRMQDHPPLPHQQSQNPAFARENRGQIPPNHVRNPQDPRSAPLNARSVAAQGMAGHGGGVTQNANALRSNSLGNGSSNPDALPPHPTPVRPGLLPESRMNQTPTPTPQSIRQLNNSAPPNHSDAATPPPQERRQSLPVTHDELERLRNFAKTNPSDHSTQLVLVKKLVEAASCLADEGGKVDERTKNRNKEKYVYEAHKLLKKLVHAGFNEATFYLADCHGTGRLGLENDPKEAFVLYQSSAKAGNAEAAYRTAVCCEIGPDGGTRKDVVKAIQWYKRAATMGNTQAMYKMGMILLKGHMGQQKNPREAVVWLKRAAERADAENPHALHELGLLYETASGNDSILRDEEYSRQLFTQAADLGYKFSQYRLGCAFEYGLMGCPIDPRQSIAWYSRAAVQEEHQSELSLSGWYLTGSEGVLQQSDTEAYLWARKAAQAGLAKAEYAMGYFTEIGIGAPANLEDAKRWYWRASAQNFPKAKERLEDLRKGGARSQKSRERLSRSNVHKHEGDCTVM